MTFSAFRVRQIAFLLSISLSAVFFRDDLAAQSTPTANKARIGTLIEALSKTRTPSSAAISPDGTTVAWAVRAGGVGQIHLSDVANPDPATEKIVGTGSGSTNCGSSEPKWSPDGQSLAFVSDCTPESEKHGQDQVFVWSKKTGESKQLTHVVGEMDSLTWSPDGRSVGFLFVENATRSAGALAAMKPWAGVIGEDGVEIQRVGVVEVANGSFAQVTPATLHVYEFGWSPDSKHLAFVAANPPGENNWWVAQLYTEEIVQRIEFTGANPPIKDGAEPKSILDTTKVSGPLHGLQIAVPRWSPDGGRIAFIGGIMSDQGSTGGDVWIVPSAGGEPRNLTPRRPSSPAWIAWGDNEHIFVSELAGGNCQLVRLKVDADALSG